MLTQFRQPILQLWSRQTRTQRAVMIALLISGIVLVIAFAAWASTPSYSVAFSGLSEVDAAAIVEKLEEEGIDYQLRGSTTILVPSKDVYSVRLKLAKESLPSGSSAGFELFDGNALGMTEFTQRVNYQRALEGELERTIGSLAAVKAVRVHIVTPEKSLLKDDQEMTTASVTIEVQPGKSLDASQVRAITHLVAGSVEGLKPDNVVVVDVNGNMLASGMSSENALAAAQNDSQRAAELAFASQIEKKVQELLDTALGPNRSIVKATVAMDWTQRETVQQAFDPEATAVRSSEVISEKYTTDGEVVGGIPGAASNLPLGEEEIVEGEEQRVLYSRENEVFNYEVSSTETREVQAPGQVSQVSLSVLVDGVTDAAQLESLKSIIAAAAGIDAERGDILAVQSLAFDRSYYEQQASEMAESEKTQRSWQIGMMVGAALLLGLLLWYISRLLNNLHKASTQAWTPVLKPVSEMTALPGEAAAALAAAESAAAPQPAPPPAAPREEYTPPRPMPRMQDVDIPRLSEEDEELQKVVSQLAEENPAAVAEIIQMWLNQSEK